MRAAILAVSLLAVLFVSPAGASARTPQAAPQQKESPQTKTASDTSAGAKKEIPLPQVPRISAEELKRMLDQKAQLVLVDTRDNLTYDDGHINGAVNIFYDPTVDPRERENLLGALPSDKLIVLYCECNNEEDSAPMVVELWNLGYDRDKVKALKGGSIRWRQLKYGFVSNPSAASTEKDK